MLGPLQLSSPRSMPLILRSFLVNMRLRRILRILSASANSRAFRLPSKDRDTSGATLGRSGLNGNGTLSSAHIRFFTMVSSSNLFSHLLSRLFPATG
jgi:hypothetical protein